MGGYFSSSSKKDGGPSLSKAAAEVSSGDKHKSKYKVVYLDRDVRLSEHPKCLGALFVLRRTGSMYMDEDEHYAHEFYREKRVRNKRGVVRWIMEKISRTHLLPQGEVKHRHPRLHGDCPLVLLDSNAILLPRAD